MENNDKELVDFMIGRTIEDCSFRGIPGCDDVPFFDITFSDGSSVTLEASYGGYTGQSADEYPAFISGKIVEGSSGNTEEKFNLEKSSEITDDCAADEEKLHFWYILSERPIEGMFGGKVQRISYVSTTKKYLSKKSVNICVEHEKEVVVSISYLGKMTLKQFEEG